MNTDNMFANGNRRETFRLNEHQSASYAAAEILHTDDQDEIVHYGKKGWFIARWQALVASIILFVLLCAAVRIGRNHMATIETVTYVDRIKVADNNDNVTLDKLPALYNPNHLISPKFPVHPRAKRNNEPGGNFTYLVEPLHYTIYLQPLVNGDAFTFRGNVSIILHTRDTTKFLALASYNLKILNLNLFEIDNLSFDSKTEAPSYEVGDEIDVNFDVYDTEEATIHLKLKNGCIADDFYLLSVIFTGNIQVLPYGIFRSEYTDPATNTLRWLIGSNLDVPFARTAFPCFDAPMQKATFQLNIGRSKESSIDTSTEFWELKNENGVTWERYKITPEMSVYSLSFVVSTYYTLLKSSPYIESFVIYTAIKREQEYDYVLDIGPKLMQDLQIYFGIISPTKKINIIGLPKYTPKEKAKLGIFYVTESDLLVKKGETSEWQKQQVALRVAGHLLEQWIETIVAFEWRQDDWLKDALVLYLEYVALEFIEPHWKTKTHFLVDIVQPELEAQIMNPIRSTDNFHWVPYRENHNLQFIFPINETEVFVQTATEHENFQYQDASSWANPRIYSQIYKKKSSNKGACLLRMIQHVLTEPVFKSGLTRFLEVSMKDIVTAGTFWDLLSTEVQNAYYAGYQLMPNSVSLETVINDWLHTDGYPLLNVTRDYTKNTITFGQFVPTWARANDYIKHRLALWYIPISYTTAAEQLFLSTAPRLWLDKVNELEVKAPANLPNKDWILVNPQQTGFYRVMYDMENWAMLRDDLLQGIFPRDVRVQLLDDALYLAKKGILDYEFTLDMVYKHVKNGEKEYMVLRTVLRHISFYWNLFYANEIRVKEPKNAMESGIFQLLMDYLTDLIEPTFDVLNQIKSNALMDHNTQLLTAEIFLWACALGNKDCQQFARSQFNKWKTSPSTVNTIDPEMRYPVLCTIVHHGDSSDFDFIYDRYIEAHDTDPNKYTYLKSLYCSKNTDYTRGIYSFIRTTIQNNFTTHYLHSVDVKWAAAEQSFYYSKIPFSFVKDNWQEIKEKYAEYEPIMQTIVQSTLKNLQDVGELHTLTKINNEVSKSLNYLSNDIQDAISNLENKQRWKDDLMQKFSEGLQKVLSKRRNENTDTGSNSKTSDSSIEQHSTEEDLSLLYELAEINETAELAETQSEVRTESVTANELPSTIQRPDAEEAMVVNSMTKLDIKETAVPTPSESVDPDIEAKKRFLAVLSNRNLPHFERARLEMQYKKLMRKKGRAT